MELWDILDKDGNKTGQIKPRGTILPENEYHLVVHVWIVQPDGRFLVSKRTQNKPWPLMWECTGGSATVGDDSITTALKEVREELGIQLDPTLGEKYLRYINGQTIYDVWLFRQSVDLADVVLQEGETCDAAYKTQEQILQMIDEGSFIGFERYPFLLDLFAHTKSLICQDK